MTKTLSQEPMSLIWDAIPAAVIAVNDQHHISIFNKGAEELFGVERRDVLGQSIINVLNACRISAEHDYLTKAAEGLVTPLQEKTISVNGVNIHLQLIVTPLYNSDDVMAGAIGVFKNIEQIRETERRVQHLEALAAIGQIAAGTVHEIRNPLTSIKGFTQLIQNRAERKNNTAVAEYCVLICQEIDHINTVVTNFLALSRPHDKPFTSLNIVTIVSDVLAFMYGESLLAGITIIYDPPSHPLYIKGSLEKLKEVLINVCRNAFQAMESGGTLSVTITSQTNTVTIDVSDTGCGMTEKTLENLFEAFYTTKETGTGLGLSICQRIIREHGGEIKVASQLNLGSTFSIILPQALS